MHESGEARLCVFDTLRRARRAKKGEKCRGVLSARPGASPVRRSLACAAFALVRVMSGQAA